MLSILNSSTFWILVKIKLTMVRPCQRVDAMPMEHLLQFLNQSEY